MTTSIVPPGMTRLPRFVLHPYGRGGIGCTLALYGAGFGVVAYRLYVTASRKSQVLFAGTAKTSSEDWIDVAGKIIQAITVRPGDVEAETSEAMNPDQLAFVLAHGQALRKEAAHRFGWSEPEIVNLRKDLEGLYSYRRDIKGKRHEFRVGAVRASAEKKSLAKSGVFRAVQNHCSAVPKFKTLADRTLCLYPEGAQWKAQEILPDGLGDLHTLSAKTAEQAERAFEALTRAPSLTPRRSRRPSAGTFRVAV